jgi:hypothetical protein
MSPPEPSTQFKPGEGLLPRIPQKVQIVNSVCNDTGLIRHRTAEYFVAEGRAVWVAAGQIRLVESHPKNIAAEVSAGEWHKSWVKRDPVDMFLEPGKGATQSITAPGAKKWKQRCDKAGSGQFSSNRTIWYGYLS